MKKALAAVICLGLVAFTIQRSTPEDTHYTAAVLEYNHDADVAVNLQNYITFIQQAAQQNADIVVFPEMTLTRGSSVVVPIHGLLQQYPIPSLHPEPFDNVLVQLSAAAHEHQIYVVVNVQEEINCSDAAGEYCPDAEVYRFNTNVVFDRSGAVIDRYRKINLFGEYSRTPAFQDDLGVFTTDFGVTFGHFICFDLMFQVPAIQVLQKLNITDVVYPTMWFSEMPFLTAVEIQEAYAFANEINFLASGASNVRVGSAGSGIYSGKAGALISTMPGVNTRQLLVSQVPKTPGLVSGMTFPGALPNDPAQMDELFLKRDQSLPSHVTRLVQETDELQEFTLRDGDVTCDFSIQLRQLQRGGDQAQAEEGQQYRYRGFLHNGVNTYVRRQLGVSECALVACLTDHVTTCAERFINSTTSPKYDIEHLQITLNGHKPRYNDTLKCNDAFYYPMSLQTNKYPLSPSNFTYLTEAVTNNSIYHEEHDHDARQEVIMRLVRPQREILTFGIWGRLYTRDVNDRNDADEETKKLFQEFEDSI